VLITGAQAEDKALAATTARVIPEATITLRSRVLAGAYWRGAAHGAYVAFGRGGAVAGGFWRPGGCCSAWCWRPAPAR